tara:strand:- start:8901 stop:9128 length:228 start_codon:yes stop_codon:yes gene_type:complete
VGKGSGRAYVVDDTGVGVVVSTWEGNALGKLDGAGAGDFDLNAVGVELGAACRVDEVRGIAFVQGDHFGADEVAM